MCIIKLKLFILFLAITCWIKAALLSANLIVVYYIVESENPWQIIFIHPSIHIYLMQIGP